MYYPYLRGKQYELLAVREFYGSQPTPEYVNPVLEPVRDPATNSGFRRTVLDLDARSIQYTVIVNPQVGDLSKPDREARAAAHIADTVSAWGPNSATFRWGVVLAGGAVTQACTAIANSPLGGQPVDLVYRTTTTPTVDEISRLSERVNVDRHFVSGKEIIRRYGRWLPKPRNVVWLKDVFPAQGSNLAYADLGASVFDDRHAYYADDGYIGFSDYATIGDIYSEGGSTPFAVVIHFTYANPADATQILIRHFASHTNHDRSDTAGKFFEALEKLIDFVDSYQLSNPAIEAFREYMRAQHFPGLGMIKKLSLLNHLYLVNGLRAQQAS